MKKRIFLITLAVISAISFVSCGENEEDTYSFFDAASKIQASSEVTSNETASSNSEISSVESEEEEETPSETVSQELIEVDNDELEKDKKEIEKTANKAMTALLKGDIDGIKAAQPKLYDSFLENEFAASMLSSSTDTVNETYGEDAEYSVTVTDISAASVDSIDEMQIMVDSFEADLEVETVRNVTFQIDIEGSLGSDSNESEVPAFYADGVWYIAVFTEIDMSQFENMDPSMFEGMENGQFDPSVFDDITGDITNDMIEDMLENLPQ